MCDWIAWLLLRTSLLLIAVSAGADAGEAERGQVALTFDDLPALTILPDQAYVDDLNVAILRGLRRHHFPAIGFVNERKLDDLDRARQYANLRRWVDAGMELGNHGYSHPSLNQLGPAAYIEDIVQGEAVTRALLSTRGRQLRFFRPPYLETGATAAIRDQLKNWLGSHGYRIAPVTIDADDWEFAEPYDDAIARRDRVAQRHIKVEYLAYSAARIAWAQASGRLLFGRDIAQIMLLHCTRLNADSIDDLARLLRRAGLKPVSLDAALADPAYDLPDTYIGADGIDWLERWAEAKSVDLPLAGSEDPPQDIQAAYDRVDNDRL